MKSLQSLTLAQFSFKCFLSPVSSVCYNYVANPRHLMDSPSDAGEMFLLSKLSRVKAFSESTTCRAHSPQAVDTTVKS
jgi:hypothetical protein